MSNGFSAPGELPNVVWSFLFMLSRELMLRWLTERPKYLILEKFEKRLHSLEGLSVVTDRACEENLGREVDVSGARECFRRQPAGRRYYFVNLEEWTCKELDTEEILRWKVYNQVGIVILPVENPRWALVCPVNYPLSPRKVFRVLKHQVK
jgi:hypothetical protein